MSIVSLAVKRPVTISMMTIAILLFGFVSLGRIPVTLLPDLAYPTLTVRTDFPGGAPSEIEQLVSKPIEETLGTVKGLRRIESISRARSEEHTSELQSRPHLVCRLLLEKKKNKKNTKKK